MLTKPYPLQGFFFRVRFSEVKSHQDNSFQEVSGIGTSWDTEEIKAGGINHKTFKVPSRVKQENLVLKRGVLKGQTAFTNWLNTGIYGDLSTSIKPKNITVELLNPNKPKNPLISWRFERAYPVSWKVGTLNAQSSEILTETLEFAYIKMSKLKK